MPWYSYVWKALKVATAVFSGYELSQIFDDDSEGKAALELAKQLGTVLIKGNQVALEQSEMIREIQITVCGVAVLSITAVFIAISIAIVNLFKRCSTNVIKKAVQETIEDA